tara:strand:+ start:46 stop:312 length:267 start_codon:yes stop_codon:yes gene_type:complete
MSKKIKKEQLESIKELVTRESNLSKDIVSIELTKFKVIQDLFRASEEIKDSKKILQEEYGNVDIDLNTGVYTEMEEEVEAVEAVEEDK